MERTETEKGKMIFNWFEWKRDNKNVFIGFVDNFEYASFSKVVVELEEIKIRRIKNDNS